MNARNKSETHPPAPDRVLQVTGRSAVVETGDGRTVTCAVRGIVHYRSDPSDPPVVVGDRVEVSDDGGTGARVDAVLPRHNILQRRTRGSRQVIAANVDQVLITVALADPPLRTGLIDRYLVAAHQHNIEPVVALNKADLVSPEAARDVQRIYHEIGYEAFITSAHLGSGIDDLAAKLRGLTTVFAGPSGAGKSSLINHLIPAADRWTETVNPHTGKGRHATSSARMIHLPDGGYLIDTPGVREFALWDVDHGDAARFFPEFVERAHACRFTNCTHTHERGCAIKAACEQGEIDTRRYRAYLSILDGNA